MAIMRHRILRSFTGPFVLIEMDDSSLRTSWLNREIAAVLKKSREDRGLLPELAARLARYFDGEDVDFDDVPLARGGEFYRRCWRACRRIPRGQTRTYGQLAVLAGSPAAARAAGQSMRHNPLPVIVPCHRVVGGSGSLHGFGGSLDAAGAELCTKRLLLQMEGALADEEASLLPGLAHAGSRRGRSTLTPARRTRTPAPA